MIEVIITLEIRKSGHRTSNILTHETMKSGAGVRNGRGWARAEEERRRLVERRSAVSCFDRGGKKTPHTLI